MLKNGDAPIVSSGFAPGDITDRRKPGDWKTRYPKSAWIHIIIESVYLAIILFLVMLITLLIVINYFDFFENNEPLKKYFLAWLGGTLGGVLYDIKWLYHTVAKELWNVDRKLWRIFTPHLSGALAFIIIILISSGILNIFDEKSLDSPSTSYGLGFLIGYFSDAAIGKLSEVATTFFGATEKESK